MKRYLFIFLLAQICGVSAVCAAAKQPSKATVFFYRAGRWIDQFELSGLDTNYINLPERSWRVAQTSSLVGINNTYTTWADPSTPIPLRARTTPSVELGFNASYRGLGGGYSWDVLNAYTTNWNLSLGSKGMGIEFMRNVSTNLQGRFQDNYGPTLNKGEFRISNISLTAWYALNSKHYCHHAATKQNYIQRKTAGSLLLSVAYMSSEMKILDTLKFIKDEDMSTLVDGVTGMITRQVAVGIGYGINYTPNQGKVLLHLAANMQVVCYSINHISYAPPTTVRLPGEPQYVLRPASPVHVTGTLRSAVSWEICEWAHLSLWAQANHLGFSSKGGDMSALSIDNWHWQVHLNIGVRFGASKKRIRQVLGEPEKPAKPAPTTPKSKMPLWVTDYFFSSSL